MKNIEKYYTQHIKNKRHIKYPYLEHYFQDAANDTYCFLKLNAHFDSIGTLESESIHDVNNTNSTYGVQCDNDIEDLRKIMNLAKIPKVYDFFSISFDTDMKLTVINLLNQDLNGVLIPIFLKVDGNQRSLNLLMMYVEGTVPTSDSIKNSLRVGKFNQEFPVLEGIIMAEVVSLSSFHQFKEELNELKPKVSSDENIFNCIMNKLEFPSLRTFLTIANSKYESQKNYGEMLLYKVVNIVHHNKELLIAKGETEFNFNPKDTNIEGLENACQIKFKETCSLNWQNAREVRKYLEMSNKEMGLVIAGYFRDFPNDFGATAENNWRVYGLARTNLIECDAKVSFYGDKGFEMYFKNERILYDGVRFQYFRNYIKNDITNEQIVNVNFLSDEQKKLISNIINKASKQNHGTMLVFHANASEEAQRLGKCGRALELYPIQIQNEIKNLVQITSIDGALMIDFDGMCYALGAILDGNASENSKRGRGARYNSGLAYVDTQKKLGRDCLAVVISEDESIDILV